MTIIADMTEEDLFVIFYLSKVFSFTKDGRIEDRFRRYSLPGKPFGDAEDKIFSECEEHTIFWEIIDPHKHPFILTHRERIVEDISEIIAGGDEHIVELLRMKGELIHQE